MRTVRITALLIVGSIVGAAHAKPSCDAAAEKLAVAATKYLQNSYLCAPLMGNDQITTARMAFRNAMLTIGFSYDQAVLNEADADRAAQRHTQSHNILARMKRDGITRAAAIGGCNDILDDAFRGIEQTTASIRTGRCE